VQQSRDQDLSKVPLQIIPSPVTVTNGKKLDSNKSLSSADYNNHMTLSVAQLETISLMVTVLNQIEGESLPSEEIT
jgi:hypothetical protein